MTKVQSFLGGVDLQALLALEKNSAEFDVETKSGLHLTGLNNAQFLMVHHGQDSSDSNFSAELIFNSERSGIMSWLAAPRTNGFLGFLFNQYCFC